MAGRLTSIDVERLLRDARSDATARHVAPGPVRRAFEFALFRRLFAAARAGDVERLARPAAELGFHLAVGDDGGPVAVVTERTTRGAGAYAMRLGETRRETFVQAPHTFSDLSSGPIAVALWRALGARTVAVSTVHRREVDVAHHGNSTFQTVTIAWLSEGIGSGTTAPLVQVHGFAGARADADVVLSAGEASPAPSWLKSARSAISRALPDARVALFPDDVDVLGGTTNVQGRAVRSMGARFVHIELGASLRGEVKANEIARILAAAVTPEPP